MWRCTNRSPFLIFNGRNAGLGASPLQSISSEEPSVTLEVLEIFPGLIPPDGKKLRPTLVILGPTTAVIIVNCSQCLFFTLCQLTTLLNDFKISALLNPQNNRMSSREFKAAQLGPGGGRQGFKSHSSCSYVCAMLPPHGEEVVLGQQQIF